ncbi:MAG: hypothetical protein M1820_003359 [Bogoriella megaspora]|nr:MAG: hypothetical protein M1820_003359 [Bogoriella megaspora]
MKKNSRNVAMHAPYVERSLLRFLKRRTVEVPEDTTVDPLDTVDESFVLSYMQSLPRKVDPARDNVQRCTDASSQDTVVFEGGNFLPQARLDFLRGFGFVTSDSGPSMHVVSEADVAELFTEVTNTSPVRTAIKDQIEFYTDVPDLEFQCTEIESRRRVIRIITTFDQSPVRLVFHQVDRLRSGHYTRASIQVQYIGDELPKKT